MSMPKHRQYPAQNTEYNAAPGASIAVYFAPNSDQAFIDATTAAIHDTTNNPSIISISWGGPEAIWTQQTMTALDSAFADAALLGVTVFVAAGDHGSADRPPIIGDANGNPIAMGLYLYDSESHDSTQLKAFLQREMSLHLRKAVTANYTIEGHTIGGQPVCVDAVYDVNDERGNLQQPMWCVGRHFSKAAGQEGTKTSVSLLLPGSLTF